MKTYRHVIGVNLPWNLKWLALKLDIQRYFSRVKTPKDNPEIERFNETLEYEWLIEYSFNRPH